MSITFYFAPQSNASRIHWTLEELGVPYEKVQLDLRAGDQRKPEFLALNPNGKVPTIVVDGTPMFESLAIQIFLGERYGVSKGLWPALGSPEHIQALTWITWGQVTFAAPVMTYFRNTSDWVPAELHNAKQAEAALAEIHGNLKLLDARLEGRQYITGDQFTIADLDLSSVMDWSLGWLKIDASGLEHLAAWRKRCSDRPSASRVA